MLAGYKECSGIEIEPVSDEDGIETFQQPGSHLSEVSEAFGESVLVCEEAGEIEAVSEAEDELITEAITPPVVESSVHENSCDDLLDISDPDDGDMLIHDSLRASTSLDWTHKVLDSRAAVRLETDAEMEVQETDPEIAVISTEINPSFSRNSPDCTTETTTDSSVTTTTSAPIIAKPATSMQVDSPQDTSLPPVFTTTIFPAFTSTAISPTSLSTSTTSSEVPICSTAATSSSSSLVQPIDSSLKKRRVEKPFEPGIIWIKPEPVEADEPQVIAPTPEPVTSRKRRLERTTLSGGPPNVTASQNAGI